MTDLKTLEKKILNLELRLKKIEEKIVPPIDEEEEAWMEQLYEKAKELVIKNNKASITFLQRKLWIDFRRASKILNLLEKNGVVGKEVGIEPRKILSKNL